MNIINKLELENIKIGIRYYGIEDLSTGITVRDLLQGKSVILDNYITNNIISLDDYINYVFMDYVMKFQEVIPYVKDEKKMNLKTLLKIVNLFMINTNSQML